MFTKQLPTTNQKINLIKPDVSRDAPLSVYWLADPHGRFTLKMMGVPDKDNHAYTLAEEQKRVQEFLDLKDQYNWMIEVDGRVIGSIWVDLKDTAEIKAPSLSIMLGDPDVRHGGIGAAVGEAVINYLIEAGCDRIYSRHLIENTISPKLLYKLNFQNDGAPYIGAEDGLLWQNTYMKAIT